MNLSVDFDALVLKCGSHESYDAGMCVMEAVAFVAGEPHTDQPVCASPVIGAFLRAWNDALPDDDRRTQLLKPLVTRLVGSKASGAVELQRSYLAFDWLARVQAPAWMDLSPSLRDHAAALRALRPLTDAASVEQAESALFAARDASAAAWDAARAAARAAAWAAASAAARAAAWDAARAAAWDAAWDAARAAARAAAWAAAWDAARAAARAAAWDALRPTVDELQRSALDLMNRMLALTDVAA